MVELKKSLWWQNLLLVPLVLGGLSANLNALPNMSAAEAAPTGASAISFNRDIRPLFVKNCYGCHGDAKLLEGNVMLKSFADASGQTGYEPVIIPGDSANSPLYKRVTAKHREMRMPPLESGKQLTADEIDKLRRWIDSGAEYEQHWSYMPLQRPEVPDFTGNAWVRNPIDAFVLQKMQAQALSPSRLADDRTLVRRLALDINGLMPGYEDVVSRRGIGANEETYQAFVTELLNSSHFGERMAVPWLDWVKYSDEISNSGNFLTTFYPYRNYVIRAFNDNKPFDRFTIEQLAGDLLPNAGTEQLIASAYNHLIVRVQDGVGKEAIHKYLTERVDKLGQIWLASSLECAQCHDHKFDVWSQKQYYEFAAFFNDLDRVGVWSVGVSGSSTAPRNDEDAYFKFPRVYLPREEQKTKLATLDAEIAALRATLTDKDVVAKATDARQQLRDDASRYQDYFTWVDPQFSEASVVDGTNTTPLEKEVTRPPGGNGAIVTGDIQFLKLNDADIPGADYRLRFPIKHNKVSAVMLRITKQGGDSYSYNPLDEVAIREITLSLEENGSSAPLKIAMAESTDLGKFNEQAMIDGDESTLWAVRPQDIFNKYRYERKDDLLLKTIHNEAFVVLYLDTPLVDKVGQTLRMNISYRDPASRARSINIAYTPMQAASPFQKHAAGPVASSSLMRSVRQSLYNFVHKYVFFTDFWDFTASQVFTWAATRAGVSAPVPFNDIMKSVLATIKERFAWAEIDRDHVVLRSPQLRELGSRIRTLERQREKLWGEVERSWVSSTSSERWPVRVLKAGQISDTSGERVNPALPDFLNGSQDKELDRLDLAQWLVASDNALTPRVMVNRIWRLFMGNGLVATLEEFGSGGERPTHPQLLDWLASEFVDSGWDVKHLIRLIVSSSTYRQSSMLTDELARRDPENLFYARQSRMRIDAEFIQDYLLAASGLLQTEPYREHTVHNNEPGADDRDRRSIYRLRHNITVPAELRAFGAKPREKSVIHRAESITPIQALASLNQPLVMRASEKIADELLENAELKSTDQRLEKLYRQLLLRDPVAAERRVFENALRQSLNGADRDFWIGQARTLMSLREATLRS